MKSISGLSNCFSHEFLLDGKDMEDEEDDGHSYNGDATDIGHNHDEDEEVEEEFRTPATRSEEILSYRTQHGLVCREIPVKETHEVVRSEVNRDQLCLLPYESLTDSGKLSIVLC